MNTNSMAATGSAPWRILIADDDRDVHVATRAALRNVSFRGRRLEFLDAYSGEQTLAIFQEHPDIALVFLDVIMETEDAGLLAAKRIRENGFNLVRIIMRTGFPGQAHERQVIVDYDIHDYKEKPSLSAQKLFTSVISALRAYDDLLALENHRRGLLSVLESAASFDFNGVQRYVSRMLAEFMGLARLGSGHMVAIARPSFMTHEDPVVVAALGDWQDVGESTRMQDLSADVQALMSASLQQERGVSGTAGKTVFSRRQGVDLVIFAGGEDAFEQADEVLLELFLINVCQAVSNQEAFGDLLSDRNAVLRGLALRAQRWNPNATLELKRSGRLALALATRLNMTLGLDAALGKGFMRDIGIATMLRDLGNEALPLDLLARSAGFDPEEKRIMQTHVACGERALESFGGGVRQRGVIALVSEIIAGHHERFDGSGYPGALVGDAIAFSARLVAVVDVFIAMTSPRPHRTAIDATSAGAIIKAGSGTLFDPAIVQAFCELMEDGQIG